MKAVKFAPLFACFIFCCLKSNVTHGQGTLFFTNYSEAEQLDAPITFSNGFRVGPGFTAQLYGGPEGVPVGEMRPLFPTTTFLPTLPEYGYIIPIIVSLPGVYPGEYGTFVMRVYDGETWKTSSCRGESLPVTVFLVSQTGLPGPLEGLQSFSVNCIPEPSAAVLLALAGIMIGLFRTSRNKK